MNMGNAHSNRNARKGGHRFSGLWNLPPPNESTSLTQNPSQNMAQSDQQLPIHERQLQVNLQKASPLYNGRIPAEIRDQIFFYSLQEHAKTDESSQYPYNTKYTRPGYTSQRLVNTSLLLTCRRVYLETYHLPPLTRQHVFFHASPTAPPHQSHHPNLFGYEIELEHFSKFQPWQLKLVKQIHLHTQMFWLEQTFPLLCHEAFMHGIEKLKLTIRRSDWWWNERNHPLGISPHRSNGQNPNFVEQMLLDISTESRGGSVPWLESAWGSAFKHLKSIKEVEIEFETSDDKKDELLAILKWARTWKFPLDGGMVLSAEGTDVTVMSWQTPLCSWSDICPYCGSRWSCGRVRESEPRNEKCKERMHARQLGRGPTCHIYSMLWRKVVREPNARR